MTHTYSFSPSTYLPPTHFLSSIVDTTSQKKQSSSTVHLSSIPSPPTSPTFRACFYFLAVAPFYKTPAVLFNLYTQQYLPFHFY